ncbi:MAG: type III toxin-antitoxin system ToxN/AbiQ family toxin [Bacilli bacterium]|nr:type III toxin-antitoxin system ToxN/AbiQ family toxin [Bacilli bacterium]
MKRKLTLVKLDYKYCDYLRKYDKKVPYNYGAKELRPFIGVLFKIKSFMYFAPLSSPKPKHTKLKNKLDLLKIDDGKLGIINF